MSGAGKILAIMGIRGIPARYGGFETLAEELAPRLADRGHEVWVYGRPHAIGPLVEEPVRGRASYRGVNLRLLRAPRTKHAETVIHTLLSAIDLRGPRPDAVLLCNAANAVTIPLLQARGARVVMHTDGLEWRRRKWGYLARRWHRLGASLAARWADELVADSRYMQHEWGCRLGVDTVFIPYGAPSGPVPTTKVLDELGLEPHRYVLYVSRFEPENNPELVIEAFSGVSTRVPLVLVGSAAYATALARRLEELAARDPRVVLAGPRYGESYAELQSHAGCYVQASEVGGTHPALVEAMGYGGRVVVNDIPEHLEVVGDAALVYEYNDAASLASKIQEMLDDPELAERLQKAARDRVRAIYNWEHVTLAYESVLLGTGARQVDSVPYDPANPGHTAVKAR